MTRRTHTFVPVAAVLIALVLPPATAGAGPGGADRPMRIWATNALHTIGPIDDLARCPEQPGKVLAFRTYVGGTGHATHVGAYRFVGDHCTYVDPATGGFWYAFGHWVLTAADGDTLSAPYMASATPAPVDPTVDIVTVAAHDIVGGTGRFAEATGRMECTLRLTITDPATFTADMTGSCEGAISY